MSTRSSFASKGLAATAPALAPGGVKNNISAYTDPRRNKIIIQPTVIPLARTTHAPPQTTIELRADKPTSDYERVLSEYRLALEYRDELRTKKEELWAELNHSFSNQAKLEKGTIPLDMQDRLST